MKFNVGYLNNKNDDSTVFEYMCYSAIKNAIKVPPTM